MDKATAQACRAELEAYRDVITAEGLPAEILAGDWATPEQVRDRIRQLYRDKGLEGAVFVGDIPVAMVRGAQHFTSAFKMDQQQFPMFDSSVPSDRFYDDFGLKFRFIAQDSEPPFRRPDRRRDPLEQGRQGRVRHRRQQDHQLRRRRRIQLDPRPSLRIYGGIRDLR